MAQQKVTILVNASDILEAETMRQGIQNVVNELGEYQGFIADLAKPGVAHRYRLRLDGIMKNPMFSRLAKMF